MVAERAKKRAEQAPKAMSAPPAHPEPGGRGESKSQTATLKFPFNPSANPRQDFATAIVQAEQSGPRWNGRPRLSWQYLAMQPSRAGFAIGDRVSHQKFGSGTVTAIDGRKVWIYFDSVGQKCILDSFVVHE
jgi:hypothetical protein